jgi:hypothetical protein
VRQRGPAIGDRDFATQLFDRADAIEVRPVCKRLQIECGGKFAMIVALSAEEPEVVTRSADRCRAIGAGRAVGGADAELSAYRAAARR